MSNIQYRKEIDGLRAIAVLSVVIFHLFPSAIPGGFAGVDIFFVISGYLITSIIHRDINDDDFRLIDFYARRARRIFPALVTVLLFVLVTGWFLLLPDEYDQLGKHVVGGATFTSNLILWSEVGYFDLSSIEKPLLHLWSLGVEEQFYLIWPLILMLGVRFNISLIKLVATVGILSFMLSVYQSWYQPDAAFYSPISRFWQLSSGGLLALWHATSGQYSVIELRVGRIKTKLLSFLGLVLLSISIFSFHESYVWPAPLAFIPVLGALLLLASKDGIVTKLLSTKIFVFFGSISFALYLWHWPLLSIHQIVENSVHRDARLIILVVSILLAYLTTRFIEKPIRFSGTLKVRASLVSVCLIAVGVAGSVVHFKNGFENRGDPIMDTLLRDLSGGVTLPSNSTSWCDGLTATYCSQQGKLPTAALVGDSHARALYIGLRDFMATIDESLVVVGTGGCAPYIVDPSGELSPCIASMKQAITKLGNDPKISTVFLTYRNSVYFAEGGKLKDVFSESALESIPNHDLNDLGLSATISMLIDSGKKVVFLWDVPNLGFTGRSCLPRSGLGSDWKPENCVISKLEVDQQFKPFEESLRLTLSKFPSVHQVKLTDGLCDSEKCLGATKSRLLYTDDDHLSIYGSRFLIENLAPKLEKILSH
jgi:peptidoglycan/LPS O-acetylase OafA/YrhL